MKWIDEKGRLWGRVSVIDLLIVLAVAVLAVGFIYKRASANVQQIVSASTPFYVTFKAEQLRSFSVDALAEGDIFFQQYDTQAMGTVTRIDAEPAQDIMIKTDGTALLAEMEDRYTVYVTLACTGSINDAGYYVNGHMNLAEGNERMIQSNKLLINASVFRVAETPYEP